jgi:hypothetical protein
MIRILVQQPKSVSEEFVYMAKEVLRLPAKGHCALLCRRIQVIFNETPALVENFEELHSLLHMPQEIIGRCDWSEAPSWRWHNWELASQSPSPAVAAPSSQSLYSFSAPLQNTPVDSSVGLHRAVNSVDAVFESLKDPIAMFCMWVRN